MLFRSRASGANPVSNFCNPKIRSIRVSAGAPSQSDDHQHPGQCIPDTEQIYSDRSRKMAYPAGSIIYFFDLPVPADGTKNMPFSSYRKRHIFANIHCTCLFCLLLYLSHPGAGQPTGLFIGALITPVL